MTQKELGNKLKISYVNISQLENDQRAPGFETIQRIAAALGCDPYSLYSWDQATAALEEHINAQPPPAADQRRPGEAKRRRHGEGR